MKKSSVCKSLQVLVVLIVFMISSWRTLGQKLSDSVGFIKIFDGKTLKGWEGDPAYWRVENGNLVGEIKPDKLLKNNSFIIWRGGRPADFELTLEYRITKTGNSGINYRSVELKDLPHALKGYQSDIDGQNQYTGQNYEERARTTLAFMGEKVIINKAGNAADSLKNHVKNNAWTEKTVTESLGDPNLLKAKIHVDGWNRCHLVIKGNHLQHFINGILMSDVTDNDPANSRQEGLLGVQVHVGPAMKVEYRNIRLKRL
ncbi:3-keto-disaccharide hydrolase [Flavitalea sp.]|nr:DUF1080 domain-containing protein [Flavitalea sp.]